ncbi:MAG: hypothetical protein JRH12_13370 [Deltaproteobacteria bacterium]|nr:hypothetical protein [Deltaproteobacteria bacterium]MBW2480419.1 hypothetical protein [Deltaproteobacteria bacterium]
MKNMRSFSSAVICLLALFLLLLVPVAGAQESEDAEDQGISEERIEAEQDMLENKIADLEEKPLEYFGSQKNKRTRVGFYKYRLELLLKDPETYFAEPEEYQGNVKTPED